MPKLRFSMRAVLLLFLGVAAFGWWRDRPRQAANGFKSDFSKVGGVKDALQLCRLQGIEETDRWTIRDVRVGEFRQMAGVAGWLMNQRVASFKLYVYDREAGFGSTEGVLKATATGVTPQLSGNWQSELPPLVQWFLEN